MISSIRGGINMRNMQFAAKSRAASEGISLREFFIQAIQQNLAILKKKIRRPPPAIGSADAHSIGVLTPEQMDEAMFG